MRMMTNTPNDLSSWTISAIKDYFANLGSITEAELNLLSTDTRKGVQDFLKASHKKIEKEKQLLAERDQRLKLEKHYWGQGYQHIVGVDEVGRGPLAGPVVAAAVVLPPDPQLLGVKDSKQLSAKVRHALEEQIKDQALAYSYGQVEAEDIDRLNILEASRLAMTQAIRSIQEELAIDFVLADAVQLSISIPQKAIIKGDDRSLSIACASILAKEKRDRLMKDYGKKYPAYGFEHHMGYGTKAHMDALESEGPCPIHRQSFKPVQKFLK